MEDYFTNSVDGARGFAQMHSEKDDYAPSLRDLQMEDYEEPEEDEDDYDRCNCSDPGCPCGGWKSGGY